MPFTHYALSLIKEFEGFSAKPYICPAGYWTIGYGRLLTEEEIKNKDKIRTTKEAEEEWLFKRLMSDYLFLKKFVRTFLHPYCWDAILSLNYNIGSKRFLASTLLRKINSNRLLEAGEEFSRWVYAGGKKLPGLIRRRQKEREHFLTGVRYLSYAS